MAFEFMYNLRNGDIMDNIGNLVRRLYDKGFQTQCAQK